MGDAGEAPQALGGRSAEGAEEPAGRRPKRRRGFGRGLKKGFKKWLAILKKTHKPLIQKEFLYPGEPHPSSI